MFGRLRRRRRRANGAPTTADRAAPRADLQHLTRFAASHPGVEAYLEPQTAVTGLTVVLVAPSGEWTRRRVEGGEGARRFGHKHAIPLYDVTLTGYPPRMRAWTSQRKAAGAVGPPGLRGPLP